MFFNPTLISMAKSARAANTRGINFLVTALVAVFSSARDLHKALADGFQLTDLAALLGVIPNVQLVVANGQEALADLADLTPDESSEVARLVSEQTDFPAEGILGKVPRALELLARAHHEVADDIALVKEFGEFFGEFNTGAEG